MIEFHDKRAEREAAEQAEAASGVETRADGSIRRPGKGGRTLKDFFDPEHHERAVTRRDYINLRASEEFSRRENQWHRKLWRWLRRVPQVRNIVGAMAAGHERTLVAIAEELEARANQGGPGDRP